MWPDKLRLCRPLQQTYLHGDLFQPSQRAQRFGLIIYPVPEFLPQGQ
jgi:hypothetical protein